MASKLKYNGYEIAFDDDKKVNLTEIWKAVGGRAFQKPALWLRQDDTEKLLKSLKKNLNGSRELLLESKQVNSWNHLQKKLKA